MPLIPFVRMSIRSSTFLSCFSAACAAALAITVGAVCPSVRAQATTHPPYVYTITDLGALPSDSFSVGNAINESGDVAGYSETSTDIFHAVLFKQGKAIDLGVVAGASGSIAYGINGYDQVTGEVYFSSTSTTGGDSHAFLYSAGKMNDIGTYQHPGYREASIGTAINDSGQIAGAASEIGVFEGGPAPNIFLYSAGKSTLVDNGNFHDALDLLAPNGNFVGNNINASGQIAGSLGNTDLGQAALFNSINGSISLLDPDNTSPIPFQASAVNDSGDATGTTNGNGLAFLYHNGKVIEIYPPTNTDNDYQYAMAINASDQIIGYASDGQGEGRQFLYTPGQGVINPNSLLPPNLDWYVDNIRAINDKGQMTGGGINPQGHDHAFLLSPVFQSFSTLATVADIIGTPGTTFAAGGRFVLGAKSNGIYPLAETLVLQLGGYHISIPPGSFTTQANGVYTYTGNIGNASVFAVIRPLGSNVYLFGVVAKGVTALPTSYPYNLTVTIGDDTGTQVITSNYNTSGLTEAEVCQDFGLTCK